MSACEAINSITVVTDHKPRHTFDWSDLTPHERKEFAHLDTNEKRDNALFVRYKRVVYDLSEFQTCNGLLAVQGWTAYNADSYFTGIVVKFDSNDRESQVVMGRYFS